MADAKPLISIIVPFYNLEGCVHYCMESLMRQTFRDYEVVCVDDGSTDSTGEKLDRYGSNERIRILHIENAGAGAARNAGVVASSGKYITFVDGDDFVSPNYLMTLINGLKNSGSNRLVLAGHIQVLEQDAMSYEGWSNPCSCKVVTRDEIAKTLLYESLITSPCARLTHRSVYEQHPFPTMKYEDVAIAFEHVAACDEYAIVDKPIYGYVVRNDSITHRAEPTMSQVTDYLAAIDKQIGDALAISPDLSRACQYKMALEYSRVFRLLNHMHKSEEQKALKKEVLDQIRVLNHDIWNDRRAPKTNKIRFFVLSHIPSAYEGLIGLYERAKWAGRSKKKGLPW